MVTRRVIEDSDEEGSDFSPIRSPAYSLLSDAPDAPDNHVPGDGAVGPAAAAAAAILGGGGAAPSSHISRSGSTDLAFFERVYQEQSRAVEGLGEITIPQTVAAAAAGSNDGSSSSRQPEATSSITDPPTVSRGKRRATDFRPLPADLTQVTTPGRPAALKSNNGGGGGGGCGDNVWDIPSSPTAGDEARPRTTSKLSGKRKREHPATAGFVTTEGAGDAVQATKTSSSPVLKRPRAMAGPDDPHADELGSSGNLVVAQPAHQAESSQTGGDDVDLVVIPRSRDLVRSSNTRSDETSGASNQTKIRETQNGKLEVTLPLTLSSSQKEAYKIFSLSSEPGPDDEQGSSLPARPLDDSNPKSSGVTVAVSTPSHFASSSRVVEGNDLSAPASRKSDGSELSSTAEIPQPPSTSKRGRKRKSNPVPTSSPDVFADEDIRTSKKAKKFVYYDDSWEPKGAYDDLGSCAQRPSRIRSSAATGDLPDTQVPGYLPDTQAPGDLPDTQPPVALPDTQPFDDLPDTQPPGVFSAKKVPQSLPDTQPPPPPPPPIFINQTTGRDHSRREEPAPELPEGKQGQSADPILIVSSDGEAGPSRVLDKPQAKPQKKRGRKKKEAAKSSQPPAAPAEAAASDCVTDKSAVVALIDTDVSAESIREAHAAPVLEASTIDVAPMPEASMVKAPPKKKRGRPKADTAQEAHAASAPVVEAEASTKKKRGRPKKSAVKAAEPDAKDELAAESGHMTGLPLSTVSTDPATTRALSEGGDGNSQKKTCRASSNSPEEASHKGNDSRGLAGEGQESDHVDRGDSKDAVATPVKEAPKAKEGAVAKTAAGSANSSCSPAGQAAKVIYRVGLSRKSRIAPLLKSLRK